MSLPVFEVRNLRRHFRVAGGRTARAVDGVSFALNKGETLGLIGESGCGKSTLARLMCRLDAPTEGEIILKGEPITRLGAWAMIPRRRVVQMIFQDAVSSLNPRMSAAELVAEPLRIHRVVPRQQIPARVDELFSGVGLPAALKGRYPHEMSGGQCQRLSIARAIAVAPDVMIADEIVSALDVSIQAQVLNLLRDVQSKLGLSTIFITHDMAVVGLVSQRIAVMYLGQFVEVGPTLDLIRRPKHPYTRALIAASPTPTVRRPPSNVVERLGELPSSISLPSGCRFHPRCPIAEPRCAADVPPLRVVDGREVACHLA